MSIKYAQRLDVRTLAIVTHAGDADVDDSLEQVGGAQMGRRLWGLTSLGINRNHLTS
jgi:hypothetical protein